jgi:uncharacterized protein (DUF2252 family)
VLPLKERQTRGKQLRRKIGRGRQADWSPEKRQIDPVTAILAANRNRLRELVPIKMGRMATTPFAFFRGSAPLMAADLATLPVTGLNAQLCGDAHVRNLGAYAAPEGHLVFDINDFDETIPGPWEWDVKRLAASLVLAGREAGKSNRACRDSVEEMVRSYRTSMKHFAEMGVCELARVEIVRGAKGTPVHAILHKASRATPIEALKKLAVADRRAGHRFHDRPPVLQHVQTKTRKHILKSLRAYRDTVAVNHQWILQAYVPADVAFKIVGTGSVGTRDYVVLLFANGVRDPLILQVKEELPSCYTPYLRKLPPVKHEGKRVADGQQRMQTVADPLLGYTTIDRRDFLVRQLCDHKASIDLANLKGTALIKYAVVCGELLAKGHARTGDAGAIAGYCGNSTSLDKAVAKFAGLYANQTESDFKQFKQAIAKGRIRAVMGK